MTGPDLQTSLHLRRTFAAPRERVFRAWTEAKGLEAWFKPMGMQTKVTVLELRVGGAFRFELTEANGESSTVAGTYLEIVPPERLAFTWVSASTLGEQTLVTVEFVEQGGHTEVRLTHERLADEAMVLMHGSGWGSCLEQLALVL